MTRKIVVVEDDQPILDMMELMLKKMGYEAVLITNGIDALEAVKKDPPTLILLDVMMTPISGWEFLERLRKEYGMRNIPVILFTASPTVPENLVQMNDPLLGMLQKPVSFQELKKGIEQYLR